MFNLLLYQQIWNDSSYYLQVIMMSNLISRYSFDVFLEVQIKTVGQYKRTNYNMLHG